MFAQAYDSPIGRIKLVSDGEAITQLCFDENASNQKTCPVLEKAKLWLDEYFALKKPTQTVALKLSGTEFQTKVWQIVQRIGYGESKSYIEIAEELARETGKLVSPRAVGRAVGANKIAILIPCHRVLSSKAKLTGYAWGLDKKTALLNLEGVAYKY